MSENSAARTARRSADGGSTPVGVSRRRAPGTATVLPELSVPTIEQFDSSVTAVVSGVQTGLAPEALSVNSQRRRLELTLSELGSTAWLMPTMSATCVAAFESWLSGRSIGGSIVRLTPSDLKKWRVPEGPPTST